MVQAPHPLTPRSSKSSQAIRRKIDKTVDRAERYPLLDMVWGGLVQRLPERLAAIYGVPVEVCLTRRDIVRFASFMTDLPDAALMCVFEAREWSGPGLIVIDPGLAETNLEILLGGKAATPAEPEQRPVTAMDRVLVRRLLGAVLAELASAFSNARGEIGRVAMACSRIETSPQLAAIAHPQTLAVIASLRLDIGETGRTGQIAIAMPMPMLDPIRRYLTESYRGEQTMKGLGWTRHICSALLQTPLAVEVELERMYLPFQKVMRLGLGDLLPLSVDANTPLDVRIDDGNGRIPVLRGPVLRGKLGAVRGNKAIKILTDSAIELGAPLADLARQLGVPRTPLEKAAQVSGSIEMATGGEPPSRGAVKSEGEE